MALALILSLEIAEHCSYSMIERGDGMHEAAKHVTTVEKALKSDRRRSSAGIHALNGSGDRVSIIWGIAGVARAAGRGHMGLLAAVPGQHGAVQAQADLVCGDQEGGWLGRPSHAHCPGQPEPLTHAAADHRLQRTMPHLFPGRMASGAHSSILRPQGLRL